MFFGLDDPVFLKILLEPGIRDGFQIIVDVEFQLLKTPFIPLMRELQIQFGDFELVFSSRFRNRRGKPTERDSSTQFVEPATLFCRSWERRLPL